MELALGELEARPGALLAVLLALLHARVAREEAGLLETLAQLEVVDLQRTGDPVTDCTGLAARAAAVHRDDDVELVDRLRQRERLLDDHLEHFVAEVIVESAAVDRDRARSRTNVHARRRRLPSARSVVFNQSQGILLITRRGSSAQGAVPDADDSNRDRPSTSSASCGRACSSAACPRPLFRSSSPASRRG